MPPRKFKSNSLAAAAVRALPVYLLFLRIPLIIDGIVTATLSFIDAQPHYYYYQGEDILQALGSFLLASMMFNLFVLARGLLLLAGVNKKHQKQDPSQPFRQYGPIRLPINQDQGSDPGSCSDEDDDFEPENEADRTGEALRLSAADSVGRIRPRPKTDIKIKKESRVPLWLPLIDLFFVVALFVLFILATLFSRGNWGPQLAAYCSVGGLVAVVTHLFHAIAGLVVRRRQLRQEKRRQQSHDPRCPRCQNSLLAGGLAEDSSVEGEAQQLGSSQGNTGESQFGAPDKAEAVPQGEQGLSRQPEPLQDNLATSATTKAIHLPHTHDDEVEAESETDNGANEVGEGENDQLIVKGPK